MCKGKFHKVLKINNLRAFLSPFLGWRLARSVLLAVLFSLFSLYAIGCGDGRDRAGSSGKAVATCADSARFDTLDYARLFRLGSQCDGKFVEIRTVLGADTLVWRQPVGEPFKRVVVLSSAQIGFMSRLGVEDRIVAVGDAKYIVGSAVLAGVQSGKVAEVGVGPTLSLERVLELKPDLVMTFATGGSHDDYERLKAIGVPLLVTSEWQEDSPLAKFEWIKLFGMLFGVDQIADTLYRQSKEKYLAFTREFGLEIASALPRNDTASFTSRPRVIAGMAYGGVWHAPGGQSYTAQLIRDAGGRYLWESDSTREKQLSLEEVMLLADSADVWVNPGMFSSVEDILAAEPRVKDIRAFRDKRVCQNDGYRGPGGGNDFYEGAVARPVELVENLRDCIFGGNGGVSGAKSGGGPYKWYRNIYNFPL